MIATLAVATVVLSNAFGRVEISTLGAQVTSYAPAGGGEVLFMPRDRDFTKDREMHGGIPVCWPWFGRFGAPGSRMHGLVRYAQWTVAEKSDSKAVLTLASSSATRKAWPYDFSLAYTVELGEALKLTLVATNTSKEPFAVTEGFHPYFAVADPTKAVVKGLKDDIRVCPGIDGGHACASGGAYRLVDVAGGRTVEIVSNAERKLVVWNPGPDWADWKPSCNLGKDDWRKFVCMEPTVIGRENAIVLKPGERSEFTMTVRRKRDNRRR